MHALIPAEKHAALAAALTKGFGTAELDAAPVPMLGGMSGAALFRIRVGGIAYVLRLEGVQPPPFGDAVRAHICMRTAAEACLAPRVRHADAQTGVVIMELLESHPLTEHHGGRDGLLVELAQATRLLHQTPAFPPVVDYLDGMDILIGYFRDAGLSTPAATELFARYAAFHQAYRTPAEDLVSSHNDLNPRNVIYDGRRLWLIDWDAAFLADRYVDLAGLANWFGHGAADDALLLATYFGAPATEAQRARLYLMRQVNLLFYGLMFGLSAAQPGAKADLEAAPPLAQQRADLAAGKLDMWQPQVRLTYGASLLAAALAGFRSADFVERLTLAA